MDSRLGVAQLAFFSLLAGCAVAHDQPSSNEGDGLATVKSSDNEFEWNCEALPPEDRDVCRRIMALKRPSDHLVDHLEGRLARHPCIGDLRRWQRLYSFGWVSPGDPRLIDEGRIEFMFRKAGRYDFRSERRITAPGVWVNLDDRYYDLVRGNLDLTSRKLSVEYCGASFPH